MNAEVANCHPAAVSGTGARLWLLFRKDAWYWLQLGLLASLVCLVVSEGMGQLILIVAKKMGKTVECPLMVLAGIWTMTAMAIIPAFAAGSFADLARPAAKVRWLLMPARLWEKLVVRWLSSTVVFYGIGLVCFALWLVIHNGGFNFSEWIKTVPEEMSKEISIFRFMLFFSGVHALGFFLGSIIRRPVWSAAAYYGLLLILTIVYSLVFGDRPINAMYYSFIIFWPLTWVILNRSRA
jgi:hypothetical protein